LHYKDETRYSTEFHFSYAEGIRLGFANSTFHKIIQELVRKGFVDPVAKGGMKSDCKSYNAFKLSRRWEEYGKEGFKSIEWDCFQPKPRLKTTSKSEIDSIKKGNAIAEQGPEFSQIGAVGAVLA